MHKLLPFRQYDEKDVINLFSLDLTSASAGLTLLKPGNQDAAGMISGHWSGTAVKASANVGIGGAEPDLTGTNKAYLGAIGAGNQGFALTQGAISPNAGGSVVPSAAASATENAPCLGITLRATLAFDENDEKLLYYQEKLDELQAVLPEQPVPVATRGFFTVNIATLGGAITTAHGGVAAGNGLKVAAEGAFTAAASAADQDVGTVLAKGDANGVKVAMIQLARV